MAKRRHRMSPRHAGRQFRKHANRTNGLNAPRLVMRGGIRL